MSLYNAVSAIWRRISRKSPILTYCTCIGLPHCGDPIRILASSLAPETKIPGMMYGIVCMMIYLAILIELLLLTDRRTEGNKATPYATLVYCHVVKMHVYLN